MRLVLCGDDVDRLNKELVSVEAGLAKDGVQYARLSGAEEVLASPLLQSGDLFGNSPTLIIHSLFGKKPTVSKAAVALLLGSPSSWIVVHQGLLTPARTKLFGKHVEIKVCKLPPLLFTFLDSFSPSTRIGCKKVWLELRNSGIDPYMIWGVLLKRMMQLVTTSYGHKTSQSPFMIDKLRRQARQWDTKQLVSTYFQLVAYDSGFKSGTNAIPVSVKLDMVVAAL